MAKMDKGTWQPQAEWHSFLAAVMFYTRLPVPKNLPHSQANLDGSRRYFPVIGLIVGGIGAAMLIVANALWVPTIAVVLSMAMTVWVTGAFHEDGFADSCDGFGGGWEKDQVLTIMKDSRVGTYALVGLGLLLATKFFVLTHAATISIASTACLLVAAHIISRFFSSLVIESLDYVQDIDASKAKPMTERRLSFSDHGLGIGLVCLALVICTLAFNFMAMILASVAAAIAAFGLARYSKNRIGGYTGDVLGAIQQLSEVAFYLGALTTVT